MPLRGVAFRAVRLLRNEYSSIASTFVGNAAMLASAEQRHSARRVHGGALPLYLLAPL